MSVESRVVVTLTVVPWRLKNLRLIFQSLQNQTRRPNKVYVNLPVYLKRKQMRYPELPSDIIQSANQLPFPVQFNRCEDRGPITKLYPTLDHELDPETIIIIMDDDTLWAPEKIDYVLHLYNTVFVGQRVAISGGGWIVGKLFSPKCCARIKNVKRLTEVSILQGHDGLALKRGYLDTSAALLDYSWLPAKYHQSATMHDDVWLAAQLERQAVKKYVHPGCERIPLEDYQGLCNNKRDFLYHLVPLYYFLQKKHGFFKQKVNIEYRHCIGFRMWLIALLIILAVAIVCYIFRLQLARTRMNTAYDDNDDLSI